MSDVIEITTAFTAKLPDVMGMDQKLIRTQTYMALLAQMIPPDERFDSAREMLRSGDQRILFIKSDIHGLQLGVSEEQDKLIKAFDQAWLQFDIAMTRLMAIASE